MPLNKEIYHLYYEKKLSTRQVAEIVGIDKTSVLKRVRNMNGARTIKEGSILRSSPEYSEKIRRTQLGDRNNQAKLTESDVLVIREIYDNAILIGQPKHRTELQLAKKYEVGRSTISDIVKRRTWRHI